MSQTIDHSKFGDKLKKKRKQEMLQQLLSHPVQGEDYINGKSINWRSLLLKWIIDNQKDGVLDYDFVQIKNKLIQNGISFNQKDSLVEYAIRDFIQLYCRLAYKYFKSNLSVSFD